MTVRPIAGPHCQHTHRWKLDWSLDHFNSSLQAKIHSCSQQTAIWLCWISRNIRHAPPLKPTKTKPSFRKPSFNITMHAFSNSPLGQGSYGHKPTPCHCPLNGANLHTFPLAQQAGPTSPKSHLSTAPLTDNCVMTPAFQDVSPFLQHTNKHFNPTPARFRHTNRQVLHSMS